jgi:type IV secretion system protein TrbJ
MNRKRVFRYLVLVFLAIGLSVPAVAILGVGDVVFDPTNYAEAIKELTQLQEQYSELVRTYEQVRAQYEHMLRMAQRVPVDMVSRYRAAATPWKYTSATDTYGTTGNWISAINTGQNVSAGYNEATEQLGQYGDALGQIPVDQQNRVRTSYGTVELTDGANLQGLETIGQMRGNASAVEAAIQFLEADSLSPDPDMNTEIAVLNKINAANLINVRNTQDSNKLLVALAEQQILDAKRKRDAEAQAINNHIRFVSEGQAVISAQAADSSAAMLAWRMP